MITPRFSCSQNADSVIVSMYCPSVRASDVDITVDETLLTVHINPYFLRLNFSGRIVEDDASSARYDASTGYLIVTLSKEVKGQEFKDLDLLAQLLAPRPTKPERATLIEVIGTPSAPSDDTAAADDEIVRRTSELSLEQREILEAAQNDWQLPQSITEETFSFSLSAQKHYGFLDMYSGYFRHAMHTENEVNELSADAETLSPEERRRRRIDHENKKWDEEYYMADFIDDEYIRELLQWQHPHIINDGDVVYTEPENMAMLRLPRKEYIQTPAQAHSLHLTLVTVLFSYAYDARTNQHEPTPESAWTICSLTPAFSALDAPPYQGFSTEDTPFAHFGQFPAAELASVLTQSYRRVLAFPLHRSFALAEACHQDVADLLKKGRRTIVRCLLEIKDILDHHEVYYVYSKIWIEDFCVWVQTSTSDQIFQELGQCLEGLTMRKCMIGWGLEELETAARSVTEREEDSDDEFLE